MNPRYPATIHIDAEMVAKIDLAIDPALISRRPGGSGTTQAFLKGDIIADQLNMVFGPLGWSKASSIHTVDDWDETKTVQRNNAPTQVEMHIVQVISDVTLTIKKVTADGSDTVFVEQGIGYGEVEAGKSRKEAYGMAVKGASTDGLKRCASLLGKAFGMMMASSGKQDDIEYAHNNKPVEVNKARAMRTGGGDARGAGATNDRGGDRGQRQEGSSRDNAPRDRDVPGRDARPRATDTRETPARDEQRRDDRGRNGTAPSGRDGDAVQKSDVAPTDSGRGPAASTQDKARTARRTPNTSYPLDNVPVTLDDQTDFGATLAMRVKEMLQQTDRTGLVRQHVNTIRNLDGPIRRRLMERLGEEGVDVDRIAA